MTVTTLPTWTAVSTEYSRATQMAVQTVEAFAAIGDMLIKLKANTKHGEFGKKCAEAFGKVVSVNQLSEEAIKYANQRATRYMQLAKHRNDWLPHNPQSMNEAMQMLAARKAARKPSAVVNISVAAAPAATPPTPPAAPKFLDTKKRLVQAGLMLETGNPTGLNEAVRSLTGLEKLPLAHKMTQEQSDAIDAAIAKIVAKQAAKGIAPRIASEPLPELSETAKQKLDRAIKISLAKMQAEFDAAVRAEADKRMPEYTEQLKQSRDKFLKDSNDFYVRKLGLPSLITEAEYKSLLSFCHPDKHTDPEMKERANRVFDIVRQMNPYIEAGKPRRVA